MHNQPETRQINKKPRHSDLHPAAALKLLLLLQRVRERISSLVPQHLITRRTGLVCPQKIYKYVVRIQLSKLTTSSFIINSSYASNKKQSNISFRMTSNTIRRPSTFLSLAPTTSASYPTQQRSSSITSLSQETAAPKEGEVATEAIASATITDTMHRRSSSSASSTDGSVVGQRYLKLGPVHWGEGDGKGDWSESIAE